MKTKFSDANKCREAMLMIDGEKIDVDSASDFINRGKPDCVL